MADSASESSSANEVEPEAWKFRNSETSASVLDKAGMEAAKEVSATGCSWASASPTAASRGTSFK